MTSLLFSCGMVVSTSSQWGCDSLFGGEFDAWDDPVMRERMILIIGQYAEKNALEGELLRTFLDTLEDGSTSVTFRDLEVWLIGVKVELHLLTRLGSRF